MTIVDHLSNYDRMSTQVIPQWTLQDRLRKARESTGLNQAEFAIRIGVHRKTVSNAESGTRDPLPIVLKAWADATGVPVEWLTDSGAPDTHGFRATPKAGRPGATDHGSHRRAMAA